MTWCATQRIALWNLVAVSALLMAGCPSLNWGSGPSRDPFLSVADPVSEEATVARASGELADDGFVPFDDPDDENGSSENGELPDRSRPER